MSHERRLSVTIEDGKNFERRRVRHMSKVDPDPMANERLDDIMAETRKTKRTQRRPGIRIAFPRKPDSECFERRGEEPDSVPK